MVSRFGATPEFLGTFGERVFARNHRGSLAKPMENEAFFLNQLAKFSDDVILVTEAEELDEPKGPKIVYCNDSFETTTGYRCQDIIGLTPRILKHDEFSDRKERDVIRSAMEAWNQGNENARARVILKNKTKADKLFWVELNLIPLWSPDYSRSFWAAIQRDVTENVERERIIRKMLDREMLARNAQSDFLAKMSHEMRTPLNAVKGFSDALMKNIYGRLTARQTQVVSDIHDSSEHLVHLISDLLDTDKIIRGKAAIDLQPTPLRDIVDFALLSLKNAHPERDVDIDISGCRHINLKIKADVVRARQCLMNLIDNAIKYAGPDSRIWMTTTKKDDVLSVSVCDNGPGMDAREQRCALRLFGQNRQSAYETNQGLGLGLPICQQLMLQQGGGLQLHSKKGVGTTVSLIFQRP